MTKPNPGSALARLRWARTSKAERKAAASKAARARWDAYREAKLLRVCRCELCGELGHDAGCDARDDSRD